MRPALEQLKNRHDLVGVEIGVLYGLNAFDFLENLDIKKAYLIDPYTACSPIKLEKVEKEAHERLGPYKNKIEWIRLPSSEAINNFDDESLDFVYIDGVHRYAFVSQDINSYYLKVKKGGLVSGHDYDHNEWTAVIPAVDDYVKKHNLILNTQKGSNRTDWWIWK